MGEVSEEYLKDFAWPIFSVGNHCCIAFISVLSLAGKNKRQARSKEHKDQNEKASNQEETPCIGKTFSPSLFGTYP